MRNIDDILVAAHKAMAASLHEAFEAGRAHTAVELRSRMAAFFEGLATDVDTHAPAPQQSEAPQGEEHHHTEEHHHHG